MVGGGLTQDLVALSPRCCRSGALAAASTTRYLRPDGRERGYAQRARPDWPEKGASDWLGGAVFGIPRML